MEMEFTVSQESDGGFVAECVSHDIFTQADTWNELRTSVLEAVTVFFFDGAKPSTIRLNLKET